MIQVTYTRRNGAAKSPTTIVIDAEKIVTVEDVGLYAQIEYAETYDRLKQPITYRLTTNTSAVSALITGAKKVLTVYNRSTGTTRSVTLQTKYIVDARESKTMVNGALTACRRVEYVPGSFIPKVLYVSNTLADIEDSTPAEVTTTVAPTTTVTPTTTTAP